MRQPDDAKGTRGILRPHEGFERFRLARHDPPEDLAPFVMHLWTVQWSLPEGERFAQEILPFPCVNLACEVGAYHVHGPGTRRFVAELAGNAWVTGVRFTPAGFSAFTKVPMRTLVDQVLDANAVLGRAPPPFPPSPDDAPDRLIDYLRACEPQASDTQRLVDRLANRAQADPSVVRAESLADEAGVSVRSLHRLFERHVGVGTKWIVRRARVQEAADRVARGEPVAWAAVAHELGYHDQAHFIRDFRAQIGSTPTAYAKRCAEHRPSD
ncbi:MAG: AraC family transcriptional regulator [Sandaracinus sp.]|nr:AraC family transcriptional regulator [Sandaracinus sp.]MCB9614567.1 AraC family transcriptional regulator [Sandaracinus sp.]